MDALIELEQQVLWAARIAGAACAAWLLALALVALRHRRSPDLALRALQRLGAPSILCRALLVVLCVGAAQPAYAATTAVDGADSRAAETALARALDGLPSLALPAPDRPVRATTERAEADRAAARSTERRRSAEPPPADCVHRVRPGDSLWSITTQHLDARGPGPAAVDRGWRGVYADNRAAIGPDPDVLAVGTRLDLSALESRCDPG